MELNDRSKKILIGSIAGGVLLLGLFGWLIWRDYESIESTRKSSETLRGQIRKAESEIRQIAALEEKVLILRERVKKHVAILPDTAEVHAFVDKLTQFGAEAGVLIESLDDTGAKGSARRNNRKNGKEAFEKVVYKLSLKSNIEGLLRFMDLFENKYERFVNITSYDIAQGSSRDFDEIGGPVPHEVNLTLETYVYNPKTKGGQGSVAIRQEEKKLDILRRENRLTSEEDDLDLAVYEYEPNPGRRDPFVDPRHVKGDGPEITLAQREAQQQALDDLKARVTDMQSMLAEESEITHFVQRMQKLRENNLKLEAMDAEIARVSTSGMFTVPEIAEAFDTEVRLPFKAMMESRDLVTVDSSIKIKHVQEHIGRMKKAERFKNYPEVVKLHAQLDSMREGDMNEALMELFNQADAMKEFATAYMEFQSREFDFGGSVCYAGDPSRSVVIINQRPYSPGDQVEEGLAVEKITAGEVVFSFRGISVTRRVLEGTN